MGEFDLIERHFKALGATRDDVVLGVGDDAALLRPPPGATVCAVSSSNRADLTARGMAEQLVSDAVTALQARGARPAWATLALSLEREDACWLADFAGALHEALTSADVALVGGDTTGGALSATLQMIGIEVGS